MINGLKVGIIIPDRGDRPEFMTNCIRMVRSQTISQPFEGNKMEQITCKVSMNPINDDVDITMRYKYGYDFFKDMNVDVIALIENDDYYAPDYLETMLKEWEKAGLPDLFGTSYTIYYHLKLRKYFTMRHEQRSSAMSTLIKPGLNITWPLDHDPYTDQWLWMKDDIGIKTKKIFEPSHIICVGMKHGEGLCGGANHTDKLHRYINDDNRFLENTLDAESFKFYEEYSKKLNQ